MTLALDVGQIITMLAGVVIVQWAAVVVTFFIFRAQAGEWHKANLSRFGRIEKALGIDDPDDTAFIRRSEAEAVVEDVSREHGRIWATVKDHDNRIHQLELK